MMGARTLDRGVASRLGKLIGHIEYIWRAGRRLMARKELDLGCHESMFSASYSVTALQRKEHCLWHI